MKAKFALVTVLLLALLLVFTLATPVRSQPAAYATITADYATSEPAIDGSIGFGEWNVANRIEFDNGFLTLRSDEARLYILIDLLDDTTDSSGDYFWLSFDTNRDGVITPNEDINYGLHPTNGNMRYQYYLGPGSWTGLQPDTFSSKAKGFGCFFGDGSLRITFPFGFSCSRHRVWELGIDLAEIGATPGDVAYMGLRVASDSPSFVENVPPNFYTDFSRLIEVQLAAPTLSLRPSRGAEINLARNPIEVTQAVQTPSNTLPLVEHKKTAARVYVDVDGVATAQNTIVYLYGTRGGVDLPGSPLALISSAPTAIDRENLNHTANFSLPRPWTEDAVTFSARVATARGLEDAAGPLTLNFTAKEMPTYWVVPINTGTAASPTLPSNGDIADHQNYLKSAYPVADVNFVRKSWTAIGANAPGGSTLIQELNDYHGTAVLAWLLSVLFTGNQPYTLPDQVYGFTPFGGGLSDPTWFNNGNGYVAWGGDASVTGNGTMAHEVNHNLDRSSNGTWGRHNGGCGSSGPDSAWPYGNDDINEVGFDTRTPWATGSPRSVLPTTTPDFMSYCGAGYLPSNWISPYRWQAIFNTFTTTAAALTQEKLEQVDTVYYVSGEVNVDGSGELYPILVQPGIPTEQRGREGEYRVAVYDAQGELLQVVPFSAVFESLEGDPLTTVYFNFRLPAREGAARFVLQLNDRVLDEIVVSPNAPEVELLTPNGGERWRGVETVHWAAKDADGDGLRFTLLYSTDGGGTWFPVASGLEGNQFEVDTALLPGSEEGIMRVIATDGFNTVEDDSDAPFTVADNPPDVWITAPDSGAAFAEGEAITFSGDAADAEDETLTEEMFLWSFGDEAFGTGREVTAVLPPGTHKVTLRAADSDGNVSESQITVQVGRSQQMRYLYLPAIFTP